MLGFRAQQWIPVVAAAALLAVCGAFFEPFNVSYDHRALIIGGRRRMLISAGVHYPRATPEMWPGIILKSKEGGADVIESYVFWNGHEPVRGQYYFEGRYDLVKFVKLVGSSGLYLLLRIGPYACAEWNFGGFPVWLRDIQGIEFRTNNGPFKVEMQRFVSKIVEMMKEEMLFSWQGGPIILLQIENEYGNVEGSYGEGGKEYVKWAAGMALSLGAGVPWVMCRQTDAPETVIDACNGFYCDSFKPNSYKKPKIWTEDWNGWYASWGERLPHRPVEDNAFAVARFFQRGGSYTNYYMFFGGTNFDRTAGGPFQITSYDYDAPVDEYGLISEPKWGHLKDLHAAIKLCEPALVTVDHEPQYFKLGPMQEAHVYSNVHVKMNEKLPSNLSVCSAFLANIDEHKSVAVKLFGKDYTLLPWSVIILPDCKTLAFNTAQNYGSFIEKDGAGFRGPIKLIGFKNGEIDLSHSPWIYQVGLKGEFEKVFAPEEQGKVDWTILQSDKMKTPFTWYKSYFDIPIGKDTIALDLGSMGKGQAWVNGHGLGRYWSLVAPNNGCPQTCNYRGAYNENKCLTNCGKPTQTLYHIPRDWLQASNNLLVIFEETGGNLLEIKLKKHATTTICAQVSETHYPPLSSWHKPNLFAGKISLGKTTPEMYLHCDDGHTISSITFASFGTPRGSCQNFSNGKCHAESSLSVISEACLGRNSCFITVSITTFSPDPCRGTVKTLAVQAECSAPSGYDPNSWI